MPGFTAFAVEFRCLPRVHAHSSSPHPVFKRADALGLTEALEHAISKCTGSASQGFNGEAHVVKFPCRYKFREKAFDGIHVSPNLLNCPHGIVNRFCSRSGIAVFIHVVTPVGYWWGVAVY